MIAIKNRQIPKNCLMCSEKYDPENRVCAFDGHVFEETYAVVTNKRDKDCPLIEIGTCKDCKYYTGYEIEYFQTNQKEQFSYCEKYARLGNNHLSPDFYCGDFKKRGNENE